jgi:hypothetical protein
MPFVITDYLCISLEFLDMSLICCFANVEMAGKRRNSESP